MRRFTNNKVLVRSAITRFDTTFISLQSLLNSMWDLKSMSLSQDWCALSISRKLEGEDICILVSYDQSFWAGVEDVCAISKPLVRVLRLVDGDKPAMGYLYEAIDRAKKVIRAYYEDKGDEGFDAEVMDGFLTSVKRMVASEQEREDISKEMEIYRMAISTFGYTMAIKNRTTKMPGKL
eukprot:PITA_30198